MLYRLDLFDLCLTGNELLQEQGQVLKFVHFLMFVESFKSHIDDASTAGILPMVLAVHFILACQVLDPSIKLWTDHLIVEADPQTGISMPILQQFRIDFLY